MKKRANTESKSHWKFKQQNNRLKKKRKMGNKQKTANREAKQRTALCRRCSNSCFDRILLMKTRKLIKKKDDQKQHELQKFRWKRMRELTVSKRGNRDENNTYRLHLLASRRCWRRWRAKDPRAPPNARASASVLPLFSVPSKT